MKIVSALTLILVMMIAGATMSAVNNINLTSSGNSGVTGMATTITGNVGGSNPYINAEVNIRLNKMAPANMVYEGWLVDNESNYKLSLGVFQGDRLTHRMKITSMPYDAIAVSTEPVNDTSPMPSTIVAACTLPGSPVSASDFPKAVVLPANEPFQARLIMQRFNVTGSQATDLRMQAWSWDDIALVANVAMKCNRSVTDVANMVSQGQTWDQIASTCNTTVANLLQPAPTQAVAGFRGEITTGTPMMTTTYGRYASGAPIITMQTWERLYKSGYTWQDVAVAANIAAITGEQVDDLLRMTRVQGMTWRQIALDRGLDEDSVMNVSMWPFGERPSEMPMTVPMPSQTQPGMTQPGQMQPGMTTPEEQGGTTTTPSPSYFNSEGCENY